MNFKKFISGVGAFAIAASAFAGMAVTASATETTTTYNFEDGKAVFTGDSRITVAVEDNAALNSKVVGFTCANNAQNGYSFAHYDFSSLVANATETKVEFDYYNTNGGRAILSLGDASVRGKDGGSTKTTYNDKGVAFNLGSDKNNSILNNDKGDLATYTNKWMHVSLDINEVTNKYSYKIKSGDSDISDDDDVSFTGNVSQIDLFGYINNSHCAMIDNLSITSIVDESVKSANYTVKYVDGDNNQIKDASVRSGFVGDPVEITVNDKADFTTNGQKYIYVSDDADGKTIAESGLTAVTVSFRKAATYNYTVTSNVGSYQATGSGFEGNSATVTYPEYIVVGGTAYKKGQINNQFNYSFTLDSDKKAETLEYAADKKNVVYFDEGETAFTENNVSNAGVRCSMGKGGDVSSENAVAVTTLPAGTYKITAAVWGGGRDDGSQSTYSFKAGENDVYAIATTGSRVETTSEEFTLNEKTEITVIKSVVGTAGACIDLVLIQEMPSNKGFSFTEKIDDVKDKHLYVTATINGEKKMSDRGTVGSLLPTNFTDATANLTVFLSNIPADYKNVGVVID